MSGAIYLDLDGTLAHYDTWKGREHIGEPVERMMEQVRIWLDSGTKVKIFTARPPEDHDIVYDWLSKHGLSGIEVTNVKGYDGYAFYDDRAVQITKNTGELTLDAALRCINRLITTNKPVHELLEDDSFLRDLRLCGCMAHDGE